MDDQSAEWIKNRLREEIVAKLIERRDRQLMLAEELVWPTREDAARELGIAEGLDIAIAIVNGQ